MLICEDDASHRSALQFLCIRRGYEIFRSPIRGPPALQHGPLPLVFRHDSRFTKLNKEDTAMRTVRWFGLIVLVLLLVVQIAGCASLKLSSKKLCEAGGGTYSGKSCTPGKTMKAVEMCQQAGGIYNESEDTCEVGSDRSR